LTGTTRERYLQRRRDHANEPTTSALQSPNMPPYSPEYWEEAYEKQIVSRETLLFEIRVIETGECVGEVILRGIKWPAASSELGVSIWAAADRAKGYGTEAGILAAAYAFDGLGVHRVWIQYLASNKAVAQIAEHLPGKQAARLRESAWAFGEHQDEIIRDCLKSEWPPHEATKHLRGEIDDQGSFHL